MEARGSSEFSRWLIRTFGRLTSGGEWIPQLDGLRFVAIMAVVLFHLRMYVVSKGSNHFAAEQFDNILLVLVSRGAVGVTLFFAISGIVLAVPFIRAAEQGTRVSPGKYFLRRLTRLEPPYVVSLLLLFALLVTAKGESARELVPHLGASIVYAHNAIYGQPSVISGVAWSLEVEFQFYVLMPLLGRVFALPTIVRRILLVTALIVALGVQLAVRDIPRLSLSFAGQGCYFLLGLLIADIHFRSKELGSALQWDLLGLLAWSSLVSLLLADKAWWASSLLCLFVAVAYLAALRGRAFRALFGYSPIVVIGGMCYTIYLYHYPIISLLGRVTRQFTIDTSLPLSFLLSSLLCVPIVVLVCAALFLAMERPFMRPWQKRGGHSVEKARARSDDYTKGPLDLSNEP